MNMKRWEVSKNPLRLLGGKVRYNTGLWVEHFTRKHGEWEDWHNKDHKIRRAIWEYGVNAEGNTNCIEMPLLGKIIKWEKRKNKTIEKWSNLRIEAETPREKKRVQKLWDKMRYQETQIDRWLKFEDPNYITRAEEVEAFEERIKFHQEHGYMPDTPPLVRGGRRFTDEGWAQIRKNRSHFD